MVASHYQSIQAGQNAVGEFGVGIRLSVFWLDKDGVATRSRHRRSASNEQTLLVPIWNGAGYGSLRIKISQQLEGLGAKLTQP
jgi:hypothetical protein